MMIGRMTFGAYIVQVGLGFIRPCPIRKHTVNCLNFLAFSLSYVECILYDHEVNMLM